MSRSTSDNAVASDSHAHVDMIYGSARLTIRGAGLAVVGGLAVIGMVVVCALAFHFAGKALEAQHPPNSTTPINAIQPGE